MKGLIATALLFALLLGGIFWNSYYLHTLTDELSEALVSLSSADDADFARSADELAEHWKERSIPLTFTVDYALIDRLNEQFAVLVAAAHAKDDAIARSAIARLQDTVDTLKRVV